MLRLKETENQIINLRKKSKGKKIRNNTSPHMEYTDNKNKMEFRNSSILKNASKNMFLNNKIQTVGMNKINRFSNTCNYPENILNLHQSINNSNNSTSSLFSDKNSSFMGMEITNKINLEINNNVLQNNTELTQLNPTSSINMYPSLLTPQLKRGIHFGSQFSNEKQPMNLEDLCIQEEKLWNILESLRNNLSLSFACEEYFDFLNMTSLQNIEIYFQKSKSKSEITKNNILEIVSITCCMISILKNNLNNSITTHLKNLIFSVHQNCLLLINFVLNRLPHEFYDNMWVKKLNFILLNKQTKSVQTENYLIFKQNNYLILNCVMKFICMNFKNKDDFQIYEILNDVLSNLEKHTITTVRNLMFNIKNSLSHFLMLNQTSMNYPVVKPPYLPELPLEHKNAYTLVLDLDETLVHYNSKKNTNPLLIRPGTEKFLIEMSDYYEIVVFTAATQDYADCILDSLDKEKKLIKHRLYRHHASVNNNTYLKDISKLGRNLAKTIIIDNVWENFQLQPENGIFIRTWIDDKNDTSLIDLIPLLKQFVISKVTDIRRTLRNFRDTMIRLYIKGDTNPYETLRKSLINEEGSVESN